MSSDQSNAGNQRPQSAAHGHTEHAEAPREGIAQRPMSVMVVDDDGDIRNLLSINLAEAGYTVIEAESGPAALQAIQTTPPDLILLDLMMPEMDGYEVLRCLRVDPRSAHVPVIVLSAKTDLFSKIRGLDSGADDYITKPFSMHEVVTRTRVVMKRSLETRDLHFAVTSLEQLTGADLGSMRWECNEARVLQESLMGRPWPRVEGLSIDGFLQPARFVGGDFYDVIPLANGQLAVLIGDVAGKGIPAAMLMVMVVTLFRHLAHESRDPAHLLTVLNTRVRESIDQGTVLATAHTGLLDPRNGTYTYAAAGHLPPLHLSADGRDLEVPSVACCPLGVETADYENGTMNIAPGDLLVLYTDGVIELRGDAEAIHGVTGLRDFLLARRNAPLTEIRQNLRDTLTAVASRRGARDDAAFLALRRTA